MSCQRFTVVAVLLSLASAAPAQTTLVIDDSPQTVHETMQNDAALADVAFVDAEQGWAVGDRGVIWHTADGGRSWRLEPSGVTCRLDAVCFLDASRGWAVGGAMQPFAGSSRGVVLSTNDGGDTWQQLPQTTLPTLRDVKFFNAMQGIAIGTGTAAEPSGVFVTPDGGRTWQPLPADARGEWLAGDFVDLDSGAIAGAAGGLATIMRRRVVPSPAAAPSLRSFRAMHLAPPTGGWLVGDGGLVMTTADLGRTWQTPSAELPDYVAEHFDFRAVAVAGPHVWVAGSPGTRVFHSPDGGLSWQSQTTGERGPIDALTFVDGRHGWAVGALGTILATADGGQTWHVQRQGGKRAALLAIFAHETDVPLEVLASHGGEEGYLAAVEVLHPLAATDAEIHETMAAAGATATGTAWRFPLPPADLAPEPADLLAKLNEANDGRALERLEAHVVRELRIWRPEVVVTHHDQQSYHRDPIESVVSQLVEHCIASAADPTQYPELATAADLSAWQVKRVYGVLPAGSHGDVRLATGQFAPRLGTTLADWTSDARRMLLQTSDLPPDLVELQLQTPKSQDAPAGRDLFYEIHLAPGGDARRRLANLPTDDLDKLRRLAARRRQMLALLQRSQGNAAWAGQVTHLLEGLDDASAGELLYQLADGYRAAGQLDQAADTFTLVARRWPDHPLAEPALRWLVQFYASSETALRLAGRGGTSVRDEVGNAIELADVGTGGVRQASAVANMRERQSPVVGLSRDERLRRAVMLGEYLEQARPALYAEPGVRFPLVVAQRQLGFANPAQRYFLALGSLSVNNPWRRCAETEKWFTQPADSPPPKVLGQCGQTTKPPQLDGRLDEPFWDAADRLRLKSGERQPVPAGENDSDPVFSEVRFARDGQFLYVAVRSPKIADADYQADDQPRPRDADLTRHDRVAIRLDTDRDYTTALELTVDHRGWTRDACWGDPGWDPTWYVASATDDATWTIEAAIPLAELTGEPPAARYVWAVGLRRTIPRVGYESWSGEPADETSPDRFGMLIFD